MGLTVGLLRYAETNLRDERYLPFENSGVVSEWQLELPANPSKGDPAQFDYNTISDVILHIRYTAREGGGLLRNAAQTHVKDLIKEAQSRLRLFAGANGKNGSILVIRVYAQLPPAPSGGSLREAFSRAWWPRKCKSGSW